MTIRSFHLSIGLLLSLIIHGIIIGAFVIMATDPEKKHVQHVSVLVPMVFTKTSEIPIEKIKPPEKKKTTAKFTDKHMPIADPVNQPITNKPTLDDPVKPVFGLDNKSLTEDKTGAMGIRQGNTLMKEQEERASDPSQIKPFVPVPVYDLTTLPLFKKRVKPDYPESLKKDDRQGEVVLAVDIDEHGIVKNIRVIRSSHPLFAQAAVEALKKSTFTPATRNGMPVPTVLDDVVYTFVIDK